MAVAMATKEQKDVSSADISFDLERLFDPYNLDHIPEEKRLDQFKQRDLAHIKHYKAAVKIFGGPSMRTRVIIAPPMETPLKHRLGNYINRVSPPPPLTLNGALKSPPQPRIQITDEVKNKLAEEDKREQYKQWMSRRRKLQENLEQFNFSEQLLERKMNKSELEIRVQERLRAARLWKPEEPPPLEKIPSPKPLPSIPIVAVPPPEGLQILDKFLSLNRMRLMDLFLLADKDKSWSVSREKLLSLVSKAEIPLSESEVDDLMITLDTNADNKLDYQELFQGLTQWRKQRRDIKKQEQTTNESSTPPEDTIPISRLMSTDIHSIQNSSKVSSKKREFLESHTKNIKGNSKQLTSQHESNAELSLSKNVPQSSSKETDFEETDNEPYVHSQEKFMNRPTSKELPATVVEPWEDIDDMNTDVHFQLEQPIEENVNSVSIPKVRVSTQGLETDEESPDKPKARVKSSKSSCSGSHVTSSRSHTSGSNSLEVPEPDLREETRVPESAEAMLDHRKLSRVVLSRNSLKRNLSPVERLTFDEIPGVIKIGYKPIDDHCSESTLGGEAAEKVNQFRQEKLKEYYEVKKIFMESGLPFTQDILDKVLLYPGDKPTKHIQAGLMESFKMSKGTGKKTLEKKNLNNKNTDTRISGFGKSNSAEAAVRNNSVNPDSFKKEKGGIEMASRHAEKTQSRRKHKSHTVEDVYPLASRVKHKGQEEELSSGTAVIKSKLDNWMTFEEYSKYTKHFHSKFSRGKHRSNPHADWTGHLLNKLYLCMDHDNNRVDGGGRPILNRDSSAYGGLGVGMYNGRGNALFQETRQMKRAYPGYNNDLLTWPVGENGVRYGSIDEHRIIR